MTDEEKKVYLLLAGWKILQLPSWYMSYISSLPYDSAEFQLRTRFGITRDNLAETLFYMSDSYYTLESAYDLETRERSISHS